ncbi:DUF2273 domain-containing protein [Fodinisporobacter ferrooxydans]|uniref:DUF2273 domain-containing protein n=1 Tax=Fodinisporobacter ferrooxydans TaxID=2901836 RepID=A0ABY4CI22_9BACL|nr:DUF2273 domain-containing protein [Alicyclobacillaceae bacterium MYW30-H2]
MDRWERVVALWEKRNSRTLGLLSGIVLGFIYLIAGFWHTIMFVLFVTAGWYIGKVLDEREGWYDVIERIIPNIHRFRE